MYSSKFRRNVVLVVLLVPATIAFVYAQTVRYKVNRDVTQTENEKVVTAPADEEEIPTGDDPWKEMDNLVANYYGKQGVSYSGTIKVIDDNQEEEKVIEENPFEYAVGGPRFTYRIGDMEVVYREDMALFIDHLNKTINMTSRQKEKYKPRKFFDIAEFKKTMKEYQAEARVSREGHLKVLTVENIQDPQMQGYKIYYDPNNYQITKLLVGMLRLTPLNDEEGSLAETEDQTKSNALDESGSQDSDEEGIITYTYYIEMTYAQRKEMGIRWKDYYPERKFIIQEKNGVLLTPAYSEYQLNGTGISSTEKKDDLE